ncbi:MAG: ABC transporter substrate-binding protein, partial [Pseudomonadota bacterium]
MPLKSIFVALAATTVAFASTQSTFAEPVVSDWQAVLEEASGQTIYWNAWGGSAQINSYIEWVGDQLSEAHGIDLVHVKLDDTANAVASVVAEKAAGKETGGAIDLIWINGENFASMKRQQLLFGPDWAQQLPNWQFVDVENKPTITTDFTIPTDGMESPWGMAKMVFFHDSARTHVTAMPDNADELLKWVSENPGRFSYPQPPDFIGSSFLKQILIEKVADRDLLQQPVDEATFK